MDSAGSHEDTSTGHSNAFLLCRQIPPIYADESERWALQESGWANFSWDVSPEDESTFEQGKIPHSAYVIQESQETAALDLLNGTFDNFLERFSDTQIDGGMGRMSAVAANGSDFSITVEEPSKELSQQLPTHTPPISQADPNVGRHVTSWLEADPTPAIPDRTFSGTHTNSLSAFGLNAPVSPELTSTPALSSSNGSICSTEDSDWEERDLSARLTERLTRALSTKKQQAFSRQSTPPHAMLSESPSAPAGPAMPSLHSTSLSSHRALASPQFVQAPVPVPTITPTLLQVPKIEPLAYPTISHPYSTSPCRPPTPGPSRSSTSKLRRTRKPYERKSGNRKQENSNAEAVLRICATCGYRQIAVAGAQRSFKRHLETHDRRCEWRCRGIIVNGRYEGGCNRVFSRRDALQRHCRSHGTCISDFLPVIRY